MKRGYVLLFLFLLSITFVLAQEGYQIPENYKELAAEYGIDSENTTLEEIQNIAEENGIDVSNVNQEEVERVIEENNIDLENPTTEDIQKVAETIGIDNETLDSVLNDYLLLQGCSLFEKFTQDLIGTILPSKVPYKNEIFNIYVDSKILGHLVISEKEIVSSGCLENIDKTYDIYIKDASTLLEFQEEFSIDLLNQKIKDKEIVVKGKGVFKKLKWWASKLVLRWFF